MKVKKILFILGVSFFLGGLFSCANGNSPVLEEPEQEKTEEEKTEEEKTESESIKGVSFNISDLTSLAIADETTATRSAARSTVSEGMLVKLLEDGTVENFINVPEGVTLAPVSFVTQSPAQNSKEIYIVFESSSGWYEPVERTDEWGNTWTDEWGNYVTLGRLLCVYENGSFVDVLATEDGSWKDLSNNGNQDSPIKFDGQGNMYYQVWESAGNSSLGMIYKYDPKKRQSSQLVGQVPNTNYDQFYVSKDGLWLFVKANRWDGNGSSTYYLRAIPTTDPSNFVDLYYDDTNYGWLQSWIYNENSKDVYYIKDGGFYKFPCVDGTYKKSDRKLIGGYDYNNVNNTQSLGIWWDTLLKENWSDAVTNYTYTINGRSSDEKKRFDEKSYGYYYYINPTTETIDYKEIVDYCFALLLNYVKDNSIWDEETSSWIYKNFRNEYEICFDEFENVEGFEKLATETKDKDGNSLVDEELFKAIVEKDLLGLLYELIYSERYTTTTTWNTYKNNFFADVLYQKESKEKINTELFYKDETGFRDYWEWELANFIKVDNEWQEGEYFYTWKVELLDETTGKVDAQKVLDTLAACCGKDAIDFSLAYFKDLEDYENLYTEAKNEEAIAFLDSKEKLKLLNDVICYDSIAFLRNTCFIPETENSAYEGYNSSTNNIDFYNLENFVIVDKSLYAIDKRQGKIVQLVDSNANPVCRIVKTNSNETLKVSSAYVYDNDFYIKNSVLDSLGESSGKQYILRFDTTALTMDNMFENIPNNKTYEVVSYTVGGEHLYCCLVKGLELSTWKINTTTKMPEQLAVGNKFKQIIIVK